MAAFNELTVALNVTERIESALVFLIGLTLDDLQVKLCLVGVAALCCLIIFIRLAWWWYGEMINATVGTDAQKEDTGTRNLGDVYHRYQETSTWLQPAHDSVATRTRAKKRTQISE